MVPIDPETQWLMSYSYFTHSRDHLDEALKLSDKAEDIMREYACGYYTLEQLVKVYNLPRKTITTILFGDSTMTTVPAVHTLLTVPPTKEILVKNCARCGGTHFILFHKITPAVSDTQGQKWDWLGFCKFADAPVVYREYPPIEIME